MLINHVPGHKRLCQSISGQVARTTLASLRLKKNIGDKLIWNVLTKAYQMGWRIEKYILHKTPLVSTICLHQLLQLLRYDVQIFKAPVLSRDANIGVHADTRSPAVKAFVFQLIVDAVSSWRAAYLPALKKCLMIYVRASSMVIIKYEPTWTRESSQSLQPHFCRTFLSTHSRWDSIMQSFSFIWRKSSVPINSLTEVIL